ncbi:MAG: hypothetical protein JSV26_04080 [bacterium]|nr:MAG: hypothetical protein JSV26_04080 [bacterium]
MKRLLFLSFMLALLTAPAAAHAVVELGIGWGVTALEEDLDSVDTDAGYSLEAVIGTGGIRLLLAGLWSDHDNEGDYSSLMAGSLWTLDFLEGVDSRVYVAVSRHDFDSSDPALNTDGWGLTLGGGVRWHVLPAASFGLDLRISDWEGDNSLGEDLDSGAGTLQVLFQVGF